MFDWVASLAPDSDIAKLTATFFILITMVSMKYSVRDLLDAARGKTTQKDVDVVAELNALASDSVKQVREDLKKQNLEHNRAISRVTKRVSELEKKFYTARDIVYSQKTYIITWLPDRTDHPVIPDGLFSDIATSDKNSETENED